MQATWVSEQTKKSYKDFVSQIDSLTDDEVRWTPYSQQAIDARTTWSLVFVLPRPALVEDDDAVGVRRLRGGVRRPQGDAAVWPLPGITVAG